MAVLDLGSSGGGRRAPSGSVYQEAPRVAQQRQGVQVPGLQPSAPVPTTTAPPPTAPAPYTFNLGAFRTAFDQATANRSGTLDEFVNLIFPQLQQQFPDIERFGSKGDKIRLPGGGVIDAVLSAGLGGRGYSWQFSDGPSSFFDDPIGSWYGGMIENVLGQLGQQRQLAPELTEAYNILRGFAQGGGGGGIPNVPNIPGGIDLSSLRSAIGTRVNELNAEPFSDTEEAGRRVAAFDNLERSRQVAIQQVRERMAAQGHAPTSPTIEAAIQQVNQSFDALRAQNENQLLTSGIDERQRRRSEAIDIQQMMEQLQLSSAGLDQQAAATQGSLGMQAASIGTQQRGQSAGSAQALAALAQFMDTQQDPMQRLLAVLNIAGLVPNCCWA